MTADVIKLEAGTDVESKSVSVNEEDVPADVSSIKIGAAQWILPSGCCPAGAAKEATPQGELSKLFLISRSYCGADYWSSWLGLRQVLEWLDKAVQTSGAQWRPGAQFWSSDSVPFQEAGIPIPVQCQPVECPAGSASYDGAVKRYSAWSVELGTVDS